MIMLHYYDKYFLNISATKSGDGGNRSDGGQWPHQSHQRATSPVEDREGGRSGYFDDLGPSMCQVRLRNIWSVITELRPANHILPASNPHKVGRDRSG